MSVLKRWNGENWESIGPAINIHASLVVNENGILSILQNSGSGEGGSGSDILVDDTLSIQGAAADAKAAGDNISLKLDINQGVENAGNFLTIDSTGEITNTPIDSLDSEDF